MGSAGDWKELAQIGSDVLEKSINRQWTLAKDQLPPPERRNVLAVPRESYVMSAQDIDLTEKDGAALLHGYGNGAWTVRQVVTAFLKRATIMQQLTNFATEFLAESALEKADKLDAYFKSTGKLFGPLHGLPVSVKEHIGMGGRRTNAGFVSMVNNVPAEDALTIKLLNESGAVIHVRTNQPQSLMQLDCSNNITGTTVNPRHRLLSPGGSSGGEGASIGSRSAVIGVGTDIGGSVRCPAAFNGCYGLRPTALRLSNLGLAGITAGQESIRPVVGPLGQSVDDLDLFMSAMLAAEPWQVDTSLVPLEWRKRGPNRDMVVAVMHDDGIVRPHPPVRRALKTVAETLLSAGIKVVEWEPVDHARGWEIAAALYFASGPRSHLEEFAKTAEPVLPLTWHALQYSGGVALSIAQNWDLNRRRDGYRDEYQAAMLARGVDFILGPAYPGVAARLGSARNWSYTAIWNVLNMPAAVFPTGLVASRDLDPVDTAYRPRNASDRYDWEAYDADLFDGVPIALQLAGKPYSDEELLQAAKLIGQIIKQ